MIIPVRCYSCGKVVGNLYEAYKVLLENDYTEGEALDALGLDRYCCRRMILTHIDLIENMIPYTVPVVGTMQRLNQQQQQQPSQPASKASAAQGVAAAPKITAQVPALKR